MNYIFNAERIKRILYDFYVSTGIAVTFYDSETNVVATSPIRSDYCNRIREEKECVKRCNLSNLTHMADLKGKGAVSYTCHAGLMETIMPVYYEETLIAYMQIGQFRDEAGRFSTREFAEGAARRYGIDPKETLPLYDKLQIVSGERLKALEEILIILIENFWEDGLIRHNRSMLSVRIDQFISEHIKEKLSTGMLCERFFLSKNALYRLFGSEFGTSVGEFILNKRIGISIGLLTETTLPITRVAEESGFADYNYFIRAFKRRMGLTPLQYRKKQ